MVVVAAVVEVHVGDATAVGGGARGGATVADDDGDRVEAGGADRDVEVGSHWHDIRLAVGGVFATEARLDGGGGGGGWPTAVVGNILQEAQLRYRFL